MYLDLGLLKPEGRGFPGENGGVLGMGVDVDALRPSRLRERFLRDVEDAFRSKIQVFAEDSLGHETREREALVEFSLEPLVFVGAQTNPGLGELRGPFGTPMLRGSGADLVGLSQSGRHDLGCACLGGRDDFSRFLLG